MYLYFITDCGEKELIASTVATYEAISSTVDATGAETGSVRQFLPAFPTLHQKLLSINRPMQLNRLAVTIDDTVAANPYGRKGYFGSGCHLWQLNRGNNAGTNPFIVHSQQPRCHIFILRPGTDHLISIAR